ncbi:hypothetical protein PR202_ga01760 [Eleusine coracana subsp. coracana]|uniref:Uncharacterized protein n=1 Tax=Eleusine coracana subsp. coracana TaxID=191504 RepID=A0AAV5BHP0_ELECO|nr:hypothetical protein PR202_ga01073 [Eleusine coracana subsp. coracana]GJM85949.1 hypothetical protein PR202_ga01760 [Eleusine coracana subsp. coracana]
MRLHPVAPLMIPHQVVEDGVEIGGYVVPKGCLIIFNSWQIMRDPAAWERPSEFMPDRFMDGMTDFRGKDYGFIPFGSGRRRCRGIPMVECVVPYSIVVSSYIGDLFRKAQIDQEEFESFRVWPS